jgi:hypothetical protein
MCPPLYTLQKILAELYNMLKLMLAHYIIENQLKFQQQLFHMQLCLNWLDSGLNFMVQKVGALEALSENNKDVVTSSG